MLLRGMIYDQQHDGSSYVIHTGHYLPMLSKYIIERNDEGKDKQHVNLKGFAVGNPATGK